MSKDDGMIVLRIPIELHEAFIGLLEHNLNDLLNYFGADLSEDEIRIAELLQEFIARNTTGNEQVSDLRQADKVLEVL